MPCRASLASARIAAPHRKIWPPPRCFSPRCRASCASARIFALPCKVWPPPRCIAPRSHAILAGAGIVALSCKNWPQAQCLALRPLALLPVHVRAELLFALSAEHRRRPARLARGSDCMPRLRPRRLAPVAVHGRAELLFALSAEHRKVWLSPRYLALRCRANLAGASIVALRCKISKAQCFPRRCNRRPIGAGMSRYTARFAHEEVPCTVRFIPSPIRWVRAIAIQHCMVLRNRNFFD